MLEPSWRRVGAFLTRPGVIVDRLGLDDTSEIHMNLELLKVSQSFLNRQIGSSDDTGERIQTSKMVDPTEGNGIGEQELEEKANFGEELENQAIASNCHQALSVKDAVDLIQGENFTSVARIPAKPRPGTVWRFHTDRWPRTKNQ